MTETGGAPSATAIPRFEQTFPTLTAAEIARLRRFGAPRRYPEGELLFQTGQPGLGMFIILSGRVALTQHDGLGHTVPLIEEGPGQFLGDVGQLSGQPALVDARAVGDVEAILIPPEGIRSLMIAEAEIGERIMRALILRRVGLIERGATGAVLVGSASAADVIRLRGFLGRNGQPHHVVDPATDADGAEIVSRHAPPDADLPLVFTPDGSMLRNPSEAELAHALGMVSDRGMRDVYDVAVVGAGPAGLATAVYAASEGLSVVVLDTRAYGGQAGASARIENYLGFPTGISGQALAGRAYVQAQKFGAEMMIPVSAKGLDCSRRDDLFRIATDCNETVRARTVVVASGARYRRLAVDNLAAFEGRGIWYWASPIEARLCAGEEVIVVGGGNSAGQAAVFLSSHARKVRMMVRRPGLAATMSRYLIERIESIEAIELMTETEIVALEGSADGLERVRWRGGDAEAAGDIRNVVLVVGADPTTAWLADCGVAVDKAGFVLTGPQAGTGAAVHPLQSSVAGVFAVGDVRSGSVKRVGSAIGEGAQVVPPIHAFIAAA